MNKTLLLIKRHPKVMFSVAVTILTAFYGILVLANILPVNMVMVKVFIIYLVVQKLIENNIRQIAKVIMFEAIMDSLKNYKNEETTQEKDETNSTESNEK